MHVDPRFTRTSAVATMHVPLRPGTDLAFLGAIIHYILENDRAFKEYIVNYTNAPVVLRKDFVDAEDLDGFFSGWEAEKKGYPLRLMDVRRHGPALRGRSASRGSRNRSAREQETTGRRVAPRRAAGDG